MRPNAELLTQLRILAACSTRGPRSLLGIQYWLAFFFFFFLSIYYLTDILNRISQILKTILQGPCFAIYNPSNTGCPEGQSQLRRVQNTRAFTPNSGNTRSALAEFWQIWQKGNYPAKRSSPLPLGSSSRGLHYPWPPRSK